MKFQKRIFGLAALGASALALASCGTKVAANFVCPEEFDTQTPVTITFLFSKPLAV